MHLVVRAAAARGPWSMLHPRHEMKIANLIRTTAKRNQIRIHRFVNVGNHLHLLVQAATKVGFKRFLRTITGRIAALVMGAIKGQPKGKFWDQLAVAAFGSGPYALD